MGVNIFEGNKAERIATALETVASKMTTDKFTGGMKQALLDVFSKVAFVDDNGQEYIDTLASALYSNSNVKSISAVFTQPNTDITTATPLDDLKESLVVTATLDDDTTETVDGEDYIINGTLTAGKSTLTVVYGGKTTTFDCLVMYNLSEATVLTETDNIDTGWATTFSDKITVCCDITISALHGSNYYNMLWTTFLTSAGDAYVALNAMLSSGGEYRLWGAGISSSYMTGNITGVNERVRVVASIDMTTGVITNKLYNVTNDVTKDRSNTYNVQYLESNGRHIFIGHPDQEGGAIMGIQGTVHSFEIHGRELSSSEINAYLAGE